MRAGRFLQHRQALDALALEGVRAGARLERAAAHEARPCRRHAVRRGAHLRHRFHRAWPGDHLDLAAADAHAADVHDAARLVPLARDQLVRLQDVQRALHARERVEHLRIELAFVADGADERALGAARHVHVEAVRADPRFDGGDLGFAGIGLHHDDHGSFLPVRESKSNRAAF